jgi:predicted transcriptional regulator
MPIEAAVPMGTSKARGIASTEDDLNRAIIKMLQQDGRLPYKDIARALEVSEGTIRNRVQSMKKVARSRSSPSPTRWRFVTRPMR